MVLMGIALAAAGATLATAWWHAMWGSVAGLVLIVAWLLTLLWLARPPSPSEGRAHKPSDGDEIAPLRLLLDQMPTPLIGIERGNARALNRAARTLFATQDCILPTPLLAPTATRMVHAGRHWRIDRVEAGGVIGSHAILALIDIEAEERSGEARAAAEMIQVMGHEVLNGLAPIVSLAESGLAAWHQDEAQREQFMPDILATLARRAESLQRFTEAYRALARLPDPVMAPVAPNEFLGDLVLLFEGRWRGQIQLRTDPVPNGTSFRADRDQLAQAVWALLQNAAEAALAGENAPWVTLEMTFADGRATIQISDSGDGVAADQRARIFHPFHTTKPDGTGIGLSLSRHIIRAHGGDLWLMESKPTTFVINLDTSHPHS
jgi:signal transduction histidine kinase